MAGTQILQRLGNDSSKISHPTPQRNTVCLSAWRVECGVNDAPRFSFDQRSNGIRTEYSISPEPTGVHIICLQYGTDSHLVHAEEVISNEVSMVEIESDGHRVGYTSPHIRAALPSIITYFRRAFEKNYVLPVKDPHYASVALRVSERLIPALDALIRNMAA